MKIYILEDDTDQSALYTYWLTEYDCTTFSSARELMKKIPFDIPDILLIDWNLPVVDGMDVLHWLKGSRFNYIPVIFMTNRSTEADIVKALTDGADDYIIKPTSELILKARIKAVTRRIQTSQKPKDSFDFGAYQFEHKTNSVKFDGKTIVLTHKEYELVIYFFKNEGLIISRDQLLEAIWLQNSSLNTRTVDTHISRLRKKLFLDGSYGWKLVSIYHRGYKIINLGSK